MNEKIKFCSKCGQALEENAQFCTHCGFEVRGNTPKLETQAAPRERAQPAKSSQSIIDSATEQLNGWTGQRSTVKINLRSMFSEVFKSHTEREAEALFIAGTDTTTPSLKAVSASPVRPWLFSRVLLLLVLVVALLFGAVYLLGGEKMYTGMIFMSALTVPFSLLIMFFEINTFKNISVFKMMKIFMVGGVASVMTTMVLYQFVNVQRMTVFTAIIVAIVEETGKMIMIAYYVRHSKASFILNGLLIGAAIGAGFATFETAGYAQDYGSGVLLLRSVCALGSHTMWGAIGGAALVLAKGSEPLTSQTYRNGRFLRFFVLAIGLHALWDAPLPFEDFKLIALIVIAWITVLVLIDAGLREVRELQKSE